MIEYNKLSFKYKRRIMKKIFIDGSQGTTGLKNIQKDLKTETTLNFCILMKQKEKIPSKEQR